ncbi:hypothetical protein GRQ63_03840 [Streptomyces sp. YIM 132580]|nr:hypothetical protein [Streptomyces sp. YIM 132580]
MGRPEALLIGGRAGVGKTTVGGKVPALPRSAAVAHAIVDGDFPGQVHPAPEGSSPHRSLKTSKDTSINIIPPYVQPPVPLKMSGTDAAFLFS